MHKERAEKRETTTERRNGATLPSNPTVRSARSAHGRRPTTCPQHAHMHPPRTIGSHSSVMPHAVGWLAGCQTDVRRIRPHRVTSPPRPALAGQIGSRDSRCVSQNRTEPEANVNVARYVPRLRLLPPAARPADSEPAVRAFRPLAGAFRGGAGAHVGAAVQVQAARDRSPAGSAFPGPDSPWWATEFGGRCRCQKPTGL